MDSMNSSNSDHPTARTVPHPEQSPPAAPRPHGSPLLQVTRDLAQAADAAWDDAASISVVTARRGPAPGEGFDVDAMSGGLVALDRALVLQLATAQAISLVPPSDRDALDAMPLSLRGAPKVAADPLCAPRLEARGERRPTAATDGGAAFSLNQTSPILGPELGVPVELVRDCERNLRQQPIDDLPRGMSSLLVAVHELLRNYATLPNGSQTQFNPDTYAAGEWSSGPAGVAGPGNAPGTATARPIASSVDGPGDAGDVGSRRPGSTVLSDDGARNA